MTASLRALLAGVIDYAGMYPPASLPLAEAADLNREYRRTPEAWMLGRFVCPAGKLCEIGPQYNREADGPVAVIALPCESAADFQRNLDATLTHVAAFPLAGVIDTLELQWPAGLQREDPKTLLDAMQWTAEKLRKVSAAPLITYFEFVPDNQRSLSGDWRTQLACSVAALCEYHEQIDSPSLRVGFKFRTGGTTPAAVPTSQQVAAIINDCCAAGLYWKATAGLHHPFPRSDAALKNRTHGFINVLAATVLADAQGLKESEVQSILDDDDQAHFRFTDDTLTAREWTITAEQIAAARQCSLRSFGSCSFDEPRNELRSLGLLP